MFREALRAIRASETASLVCPKCSAANRPGATVIEIDQTGTRAFCSVCTAERDLTDFQPKENK